MKHLNPICLFQLSPNWRLAHQEKLSVANDWSCFKQLESVTRHKILKQSIVLKVAFLSILQ